MNCVATFQLNNHLDRVDGDERMKEVEDDIINALIQGADYTYEDASGEYTFYAESVLDSIQSELDSGDFCELIFGMMKSDDEQVKRFNDLMFEHAERLVEEYFR